jgi:hypothetical protein
MDITSWNCKKTYSLDQNAVKAAMGIAKRNSYDVPCPMCGKENRTKREQFEAASQTTGQPARAEPKMRSVDIAKAKRTQGS